MTPFPKGGGAGPVPCVWARKGGVFTRDPESSRAPFLPQCGESARPRPLAPRGSLLELLQSLLDRLEALLELLPPLGREPAEAEVVRREIVRQAIERPHPRAARGAAHVRGHRHAPLVADHREGR